MLGVALIIGVARGITVIMNNGLITDTVLYWAEQAVSGLSSVAFIIVTYLLYLPLSFLIPSSSGLATVSMPIMAPLAQFAGVPSYLVVTAYQTANGLINLVTPTSAVVMGGLAIARVGYGTWLTFVWPVLLLVGDPQHPGAGRVGALSGLKSLQPVDAVAELASSSQMLAIQVRIKEKSQWHSIYATAASSRSSTSPPKSSSSCSSCRPT